MYLLYIFDLYTERTVAEDCEIDDVDHDYDDECDVVDLEVDDDNDSRAATIAKRGRKQWITPRLLSALDNAKVTNGKAVHILIAAAEALGHRVDGLIVNRTTIHRLREENRQNALANIQADFIENVILSSV